MTNSALGDSLHRLMHAYKRQLRSGIQHHQISLPITHIRVLKAIYRIPEITAGSIAQRMSQDKAQITRVLNELVQLGLVEKTANSKDRRSHFLVATHTGVELLSRVDLLEEQAAAHMTANLSSAELASFVRIANIMIDNASAAHSTDKGDELNG